HAACTPSGAHTQLETPFLIDDTRRGVPASVESSQSCARAVGVLLAATAPVSSGDRDEMNEIVLPSGSHRGALGDQPSLTSCRGAPEPSVRVIQIEGMRRFRARSTRETT